MSCRRNQTRKCLDRPKLYIERLGGTSEGSSFGINRYQRFTRAEIPCLDVFPANSGIWNFMNARDESSPERRSLIPTVRRVVSSYSRVQLVRSPPSSSNKATFDAVIPASTLREQSRRDVTLQARSPPLCTVGWHSKVCAMSRKRSPKSSGAFRVGIAYRTKNLDVGSQ